MRLRGVFRQFLSAVLCAVFALPVFSTSEISTLSSPKQAHVSVSISDVHELTQRQHWSCAKYYGKNLVRSAVTYDYDAFGNLIHSTGTTPNNYLFSGEQFDSDLNLYYNRARYLNSSTGRFWTMDTYEGNDQDSLSLHKYLYAEADPINNVDPCGRCLPSNPTWGDIIQKYIFEDFRWKTGGVGINVSISDILKKTVPSGSLMPDLIDPNTLSVWGIGQVYEIKSVYSGFAAAGKVALYVSVLNAYGRDTGLRWIPGITYIAPPIVPISPSTIALINQPAPGVITYCVINQTELVALALAANTAALYLDLGAATLVAAYGFA